MPISATVASAAAVTVGPGSGVAVATVFSGSVALAPAVVGGAGAAEVSGKASLGGSMNVPMEDRRCHLGRDDHNRLASCSQWALPGHRELGGSARHGPGSTRSRSCRPVLGEVEDVLPAERRVGRDVLLE